MKKAIALSLFVLSACNTGNVTVNSGSTNTSPTPGAIPGTVQGSSTGGSSGPGQPGTTGDAAPNRIFFERILVRNAIPQSLLAISFSPENAKDGFPFGVSLLGNQVFSERAPFTPGKNDVVYLRAVDVGTYALLSTSLDSLKSSQVFSFPRELADYSLNSDHSAIAWIDQAGVLSVSKFENGMTENLDTSLGEPNTLLTHVNWNSDDSYLLARADDGEALLYNKNETAKPTVLAGVDAASFSNDGTQLAYFNSEKKALHILDLASGKEGPIGTLESSDLHDLIWSSATSVSYWTTLPSGTKELRVFSSANQETTVATLTLPSSVKDGVVCPAWVGSKVYFGNYDSGKYVIEQINLGKDAKKTDAMKVFAETSDADLGEGFVCPKVTQ